jgi:hypothetical protein
MPVAPFVWPAAQFLGELGRLLPLTRLKEAPVNFIMGRPTYMATARATA